METPRKRTARLNADEQRSILSEYAKGRPVAKIAADYRVSRRGIYKLLARTKTPLRGGSTNRPKALHLQNAVCYLGLSTAEVAAIYEVSVRTVQRWKLTAGLSKTPKQA